MELVRVFSETYKNAIKFSRYDSLHPLFHDLFSSLGDDLSGKWGKENIVIENEILSQVVEALHKKISQLVIQYVPSQDPTHILVFDSQTLKLNVRKDLDRLLAHLLLIMDMGKHCIRNQERLKIEIVDE
jgi:hypothetical protein